MDYRQPEFSVVDAELLWEMAIETVVEKDDLEVCGVGGRVGTDEDVAEVGVTVEVA